MPVHAVVLPATVLLVPGSAGSASPLGATRSVVADEVDRLGRSDGGGPVRWGVLAPAARTSTGRRRPSLAAAGVADRWVPALRGSAPQGPHAAVPASVALLILAEVIGSGAAQEALVVELGPEADDAARSAAVAELAGCDRVLVAGGVPGDGTCGPTTCAPAVAGVLDVLSRSGGWTSTTRTVVEHGPHLGAPYVVVTWSGPRDRVPAPQATAPANQPTPVSSSQNRTVRPTRSVGT